MMHNALLDVGCLGAVVAMVMKTLFAFDVKWHWAAAIGASTQLVGPWLETRFGTQSLSMGPMSELIGGAIVALAVLSILQVLRGYN